MIESELVSATDIWKSIEEIAEGRAGMVYKVHANSEVYLLKIYKDSKNPQAIYQEFNIMKSISGPYPKYYILYEKLIYLKYDIEPHFAILSEFIEGGNLLDVIGKQLDKEKLRLLFKALAAALYELHLLNIVHRDIKAENIILSPERGIVIIDFDTACKEDGINIEKRVGTLDYFEASLAAIYYIDDIHDMTFTQWLKADVWSLGVLFYEIAHGHLPFSKPEDEEGIVLRNIIKNEPIITEPKSDPTIRQIIKHMLEKNPQKRISSFELYKTLSYT